MAIKYGTTMSIFMLKEMCNINEEGCWVLSLFKVTWWGNEGRYKSYCLSRRIKRKEYRFTRIEKRCATLRCINPDHFYPYMDAISLKRFNDYMFPRPRA